MAMFEIKDSEDIQLQENKSADPTLLKAENVRRLSGAKNEAGFPTVGSSSKWAKARSFVGNVFVQIVGGVVLLAIGALLIKYWPSFFSK